jgi:hypothetical protein
MVQEKDMEQSMRSNIKTIAITLMITVITQILYVALLAEVGIVEGWPLRSSIWTVETVAFTVLSVAGLAALVSDARHRLVWAALTLSGLFNAIQAGIGLSMFLPATEGAGAESPLFTTILAGAFLFFFLAKALIGMAGIGLGISLLRGGDVGSGGGAAKAIGGLAIVTGAVGAAANIIAMPLGMELVFAAGATGTLATLFTAIAAWMVAGKSYAAPGIKT